MLRASRRFATFYENLQLYRPALTATQTPEHFKHFTALTVAPIFMCGSSALAASFFPVLHPVLPMAAELGSYYIALYSTFMAGIHVGIGATLYDPHTHTEDTRQLKQQILYPFAVPFFGWLFTSYMWAMPFSHAKSLNCLCGLGFLFVGSLLGDLAAVGKGTAPSWFRFWKRVVTTGSVLGVLMLAGGIYFHPELYNFPAPKSVKSIQQLYEETPAD